MFHSGDITVVTSIAQAVIALAIPANTLMLVILGRRQKLGNHHTETIRQLSKAVADERNGGVDLAELPPEELGERVTDALREGAEDSG